MSDPITCPKCRRWYVPGEEPDPCLGMLPGVTGACCGHGNEKISYLAFAGSAVIVRPFHVERDCGVFRPERRP